LLLAFLLIPATLAAQSNSAEGNWRGELITDAFRGEMQLTFSRAGTWSLLMSVKVGGRVASGQCAIVRLDADSVIFTSNVGGAATRYAGSLEGDSLGGVMEARSNNELLGRGTWRLARQARAVAFVPDSQKVAVKVSPRDVFDEAWRIVDTRYGNFPSKGIDWNLIGEMYRDSAAAAPTDEALASILSSMLSHLNDKHISLRAGGRLYRPAGEIDTSQFIPDAVMAKKLRGGVRRGISGHWQFGWLPDSTGYLRIDAFEQYAATRAFLDRALNEFRGARGLIIDLRKHFGGDDRTANAVINRFAARRELYLKRRTRTGNGHSDFMEPHEFYYEPEGSWQFKRPVVVLTSRRTVSAGENFLIGMRRLPQVTVIGDVTAGAFADVGHFTLANGWQLNVPYNRIVEANEMSWEGVGLAPDIRVVPTREAIREGKDPVLDVALRAVKAASEKR
jgi:C-terminal processing protease CtpA/Prc